MKRSPYQIIVLVYLVDFCSWQCLFCSSSADQMQELYQKIGEGLISVRKQFADAQPKIYTVLDQIDKMYGIAKGCLQKKDELEKALAQKESENQALKKALEKTKSELTVAQQISTTSQQALNEIHQKFEAEKQQTLMLAQEKNNLVEKIKKIADNSRQVADEKRVLTQAENPDEVLQSLTRNSTSEPSSSR